MCDTTIPLYLGRIGRIDLLAALFAPVYIPEVGGRHQPPITHIRCTTHM
jgi:hypothetical protein